MGYSTSFEGVLKFGRELTASQLAYLTTLLDKDGRGLMSEEDLVTYRNNKEFWVWTDLKITDDFSGVEWNGAEKTYNLEGAVNFITRKMREKYPDFKLTGEMTAQGEDFDDIWRLVMEDGIAKRENVVLTGTKVECPACGYHFRVEVNNGQNDN